MRIFKYIILLFLSLLILNCGKGDVEVEYLVEGDSSDVTIDFIKNEDGDRSIYQGSLPWRHAFIDVIYEEDIADQRIRGGLIITNNDSSASEIFITINVDYQTEKYESFNDYLIEHEYNVDISAGDYEMGDWVFEDWF